MLITDNEYYSDAMDTERIILSKDEIFKNLEIELDTSRTVDLNTQDTAYIIYTSGSTGNPKELL